MIKGRDLSNLSTKNDEEKALNSIIEYFGIEYLTKNIHHSLPKLWARPDRLSTIELYILGICLGEFDGSNQKWLKDTIRRIKSESPRNATGLFTEILFFGYFNLKRSKIIPAKAKNPGYDFSIEFPNGNKQYISIKNIDTSDSQNTFLSNCKKLRNQWRLKLTYFKCNLNLQVFANHSLEEVDFISIIDFIKSRQNLEINKHILNNNIVLNITRLPSSTYTYAPSHTSDILQVFCPSQRTESIRYTKKVRQAVNNLKKHTATAEIGSRVLFLRMDASANYFDMQAQIKELIDNKEIDCIICYQPSYVRDTNGSSLINHCFKIEASPEFALNMGGSDHIQIIPPVGSVSSEQAKLQVIDSITGKSIDIPPHHYFFQKGDLYYLCKNDSKGSHFDELGSPAPGITKHAVFALLNKPSFTIKPKTIPAYDNLTLV